MAEQPKSNSLRDYAEFELERRGYNRAQVDAFLAELDQAFIELEKSVKERGDELAELQREVERLKRESPVGRSEELLRRAELNAEQMLASSLTESQEIIANAEAIAMRIIANARAQSQEIASQPAGFGMLARVRSIAADIDRMKAEHAALMEEDPDQLAVPAVAEAESPDAAAEAVGDAPTPVEPETVVVAERQGVEANRDAAVAEWQAAEDVEPQRAAEVAPVDEPAPAASEADTGRADDVEVLPRIQLVGPPLPEPVAAVEQDEEEDFDEAAIDTRNFDWSEARAQVQDLDEAGPTDPLAMIDDDDDVPSQELPTIMRRQGSRYERHSASLPKIGSDGESTLSDVAKVSRRRRRRAATRDDETS